MESRFALSTIALSIGAVLPAIAFSQTATQSDAATHLAQDCRADFGNGLAEDDNAGSGNTESLSEQLDRCDGVKTESGVTGKQESKTEKAIEAGSGVYQIVAAITKSAKVAE